MFRLALLIASWAAVADAFAPMSLPVGSVRSSASLSGLRMQIAPMEQKEATKAVPAGTSSGQPVAKKGFLLRRESPLTYSDMAGNKGFDPFNLAYNPDKLYEMRSAELKHGRLAMLAALGMPASEVMNSKLALLAGLPNGLADRMAPSPWAGGLEKHTIFMGVAAGLAMVGEGLFTQLSENKPGHFGFDPLDVYNTVKTDEERKTLEEKEINHARLAMLGVTSMVAQQFMTKAPLIDF